MMPAADVITLAIEAERLGYRYCMVADEGVHPDIYACLGVIARETDRIRLGVMTNGYTRHPAVTAAALATVNELSGGRVVVTMLAGGSMVLGPMAIKRHRPYAVMADAVEILRLLWSGEVVKWKGEIYSLDGAQLGLGPQGIPLWIAGRGPKVLGLAGRKADGVILTVKPDLGAALRIVDDAADEAGRDRPERMYLGRICYTPDLLEGQRRTLSYVLMDSPRRVLSSLGISDVDARTIEDAVRMNDPALVDPIVSDRLLADYQVAGTPQQCGAEIRALTSDHGLGAVLIDALSSDLAENLAVLRESFPIITESTAESAP